MVAPLLIALVALAAYVWLGIAVEHRPPEPLWDIDIAGQALAGHATHLALVFTISCWWFVLVALGWLAALLAWRVPAWRGRVMFSIITTVVAWQTSDVLKNIFMRPRPAHWFLHDETSYGYSSGHAMFAVVVYALWSYFIATSTAPRSVRIGGSIAFAAWGCAVVWSRLALGVHYVTDLIGGALLGVAMLALAVIVAELVSRARVQRASPSS
jgi:membrane-associated phospholipid phosphatase